MATPSAGAPTPRDRSTRRYVVLIVLGLLALVVGTLYRLAQPDRACITVSSEVVGADDEPTAVTTEACPQPLAVATTDAATERPTQAPPRPVPTEESEPDTAEPTGDPHATDGPSSPPPIGSEGPSEPDETEVLVLARRSLEAGTIVYSSPHEMTVGETGTVVVRIVRGTQAPREVVEGVPGPVEQEPVDVGARMKATLVGPDFDIVPIGEPIQALVDDRFVEWMWRVTPEQDGQRELVLTIAALHEDTAVAQVTKVRTIAVDVDRGGAALNWFAGNWSELLQVAGVSGTTLGAAGVAWLRRRRRQPVAAPTA